jgi:CMP-N-acetylneuraminic acid synthetase
MITAFLPCRAGSERVPKKNTRPFAGYSTGLIGLKLEQLAACAEIDRILLSTNDPEVIAIATDASVVIPKLEIDLRPDHLCTPQTSTDELIAYVPDRIDRGVVLWTHVTSPMVDAAAYSEMIAEYTTAVADGESDSLMSVTGLRTFLWTATGPLNYDRAVEKWPRTQTLQTLYSVNSAAFMIDVELMRGLQDRVGRSPKLFEMTEAQGFEIDWEEQFALAEVIYQSALGPGGRAS